MKKKIIALTLGFSLLVSGALNAFAGETEQDTLQSLYDELVDSHVIRNILSNHQNVERHVINWNAAGEEVSSSYEYVDDEMSVYENSDKYVSIQYKDGFYEYDPSVMGQIQAYFTMSEIAAQEWEELMDIGFGFSEMEDERIIETEEYEDSLHITMEVDAQVHKEIFPTDIVDSVDDNKRGENSMEWMDAIGKAIQYMEDHITEEVDGKQVAFKAYAVQVTQADFDVF